MYRVSLKVRDVIRDRVRVRGTSLIIWEWTFCDSAFFTIGRWGISHIVYLEVAATLLNASQKRHANDMHTIQYTSICRALFTKCPGALTETSDDMLCEVVQSLNGALKG